MTPSQIHSALKTLIGIRQPVFIWGPPGVGKSQLVAQVAACLGMSLRDIRAVLLDPVDLRGLPRITSEGTAQWCPPAFPTPSTQFTRQGVIGRTSESSTTKKRKTLLSQHIRLKSLAGQ